MTSLPAALGRSPCADTPREPIGRQQLSMVLAARFGRLVRWEFWPAWVIYLLLLPHFLWLSIRFRSLTIFTSANPGMPLGGLVGESKYDILKSLPAEWIVPTAAIESAAGERDEGERERLAALDVVMSARGWIYPVILKPDVGERGKGVALVRSRKEAAAYFAACGDRVIVQTYHAGPYEIGVFYVRRPGEEQGTIFSITQKQFPSVVGDGVSSIRGLIWRHERLRLQAAVFLATLGREADRVPMRGERIALSIAGNHCRGTMFLDGGRLMTDALTRSIDAISRRYEGFYFGRYDIRYSDETALSRGEDFKIVELNGVLSESTNIYDPSWPLRKALRTLGTQWLLAFEIGHANAARGAKRSGIGEVARAIWCRGASIKRRNGQAASRA